MAGWLIGLLNELIEGWIARWLDDYIFRWIEVWLTHADAGRKVSHLFSWLAAFSTGMHAGQFLTVWHTGYLAV